MKLILIALCFGLNAVGSPNHEHPVPKISAHFEALKSIVGTWEGTTKMEGKDQPTKATYELTSGGTAIIEKLMPGTPQEMVTVYANRGNEVNATHFCMVGNQPEMKLKKVDGTTFVFEMNGTRGISAKNEMHMHAVTLTLVGNKLKQEWVSFKDGKKAEVAVFEFTKKN